MSLLLDTHTHTTFFTTFNKRTFFNWCLCGFCSSVKCYECSEAENCRICPRSIKLPPPHFAAESFELYGLSEVLDYKIEVLPQIHFEFCIFIRFLQIIAENEISAAAHQAGIPPAVTTFYSEKILKGEI